MKSELNFIRISIWITMILAILKVTNVINISILWVLMPVIVSVGIVFLLIFGIGCITILYISTHMDELKEEMQKEVDKKEQEKSEIEE